MPTHIRGKPPPPSKRKAPRTRLEGGVEGPVDKSTDNHLHTTPAEKSDDTYVSCVLAGACTRARNKDARGREYSYPSSTHVRIEVVPTGFGIDTIRMPISGRWRHDVLPGTGRWKLCGNKSGPAEWEARGGYYYFPKWEHESGLRILGGARPAFVEGSLLSVLHGHNAKLMQSESDLQAASGRFVELVSDVVSRPSFGNLTRLDLTAHVQVPVRREVLRGLMRAKHPAFRGIPERGIAERCRTYSTGWKLKGTGKTLTVYDKAAEIRSRGLPSEGTATRIELSLQNPVLRKLTGNGPLQQALGVPLHSLTLARCESVLWTFLDGFRGGFDFTPHRPNTFKNDTTGNEQC